MRSCACDSSLVSSLYDVDGDGFVTFEEMRTYVLFDMTHCIPSQTEALSDSVMSGSNCMPKPHSCPKMLLKKKRIMYTPFDL